MKNRQLKLKELFTGRRVYTYIYGEIEEITVIQNAKPTMVEVTSSGDGFISFTPMIISKPDVPVKKSSPQEEFGKTSFVVKPVAIISRKGEPIYVDDESLRLVFPLFKNRQRAQVYKDKIIRIIEASRNLHPYFTVKAKTPTELKSMYPNWDGWSGK